MGGKRRTTTDLILDMKRLEEKLGHPPTKVETNQAAAKREIASAPVYLKRFGIDQKTGKQSWTKVLEACGMKMPSNRYGRGHKLDPKEKAKRECEKNEKRTKKEEQAKKKRIAKYQAKKRKSTPTPPSNERSSVRPPTNIGQPAPQQAENLLGRTSMADHLELINLLGYKVILMRRKKTEFILPSGKLEFYAESYKSLNDQTIDCELQELFGGIETRRVHMPFHIVDNKGEQHRFPEPQAGTYYLLPRKQAELIASTGRTMNDLIFPLQYRTNKDTITILSVGIKLETRPRIVDLTKKPPKY